MLYSRRVTLRKTSHLHHIAPHNMYYTLTHALPGMIIANHGSKGSVLLHKFSYLIYMNNYQHHELCITNVLINGRWIIFTRGYATGSYKTTQNLWNRLFHAVMLFAILCLARSNLQWGSVVGSSWNAISAISYSSMIYKNEM